MSNKVQRHTWGLREALFEEWDAMRRGSITPQRAVASAKIAQVIMQSVVVEMAVVKSTNEARRREGDLHPISAHIRLGVP